MEVTEATGNAKKILEQIMIERLLDAVSPELRAWLKEQKPKTTEELGNLANLVAGKFASFCKNQGFKQKKEANFKKEIPAPGQKLGQRSTTPPKPTTPNAIKNSRPEITCFKCGKKPVI